MTSLRLIPAVAIAAAALLGLKAIDLARDGRPRAVMEAGPSPTVSERLKALMDPFDLDPVDPIVTGAAGGGGGHEKPEAKAADSDGMKPAAPKVDITTEKPKEAQPPPGQELLSEIAILQKLNARRKALEEREKELEMRENLLKATEDKLGQRVDELKTIENKIGGDTVKKEADKGKELADLVKMYETMKAKDAARVFDRLDTKLLVDIARQMNPKKLGDVVSKMAPEAAEKLTVELANRKPAEAAMPPGRELPKIGGKS